MVKLTNEILNINKSQISLVTGLLTGHWSWENIYAEWKAQIQILLGNGWSGLTNNLWPQWSLLVEIEPNMALKLAGEHPKGESREENATTNKTPQIGVY